MRPGETVNIEKIKVQLAQVTTRQSSNYHATVGHFLINGKPIVAEERLYLAQKTRHLETALTNVNFLSQILVMLSLVPEEKNESYAVKIIYKPYINIMWGGFFLVIFGFFLSTIYHIISMHPRKKSL